jgi:hypothetical protein
MENFFSINPCRLIYFMFISSLTKLRKLKNKDENFRRFFIFDPLLLSLIFYFKMKTVHTSSEKNVYLEIDLLKFNQFSLKKWGFYLVSAFFHLKKLHGPYKIIFLTKFLSLET